MNIEKLSKQDKELAGQYLKQLKRTGWEGSADYLYLDTKGYLTTGIGCLISELNGEGSGIERLIQATEGKLRLEQVRNPDQLRELAKETVRAASIQNLLRDTERRLKNEGITFIGNPSQKVIHEALEELISLSILVKAFSRIAHRKHQQWAHLAPVASFYAGGSNTLKIAPQLIEKLAVKRIGEAIAELKAFFSPNKALTYSAAKFAQVTGDKVDPSVSKVEFVDVVGYEGYPDSVREALLELTYNMGIAKLEKYDHLVFLVRLGKWSQIVKKREYHRIDPNFSGFVPGFCTDKTRRVDVTAQRNAYVCKLFSEAAKDSHAMSEGDKLTLA